MPPRSDPIEILVANPATEIDLRGLEILARQRKGRGRSGRGGPPGTSQHTLRGLLVMGHLKEARKLRAHAAAKEAIKILGLRSTPRRLEDLYRDHTQLILEQLTAYPLELRLLSKRPGRKATIHFWDNMDDRYDGPSGGIRLGGSAATVFVPARARKPSR
jgi:hypothetical protein